MTNSFDYIFNIDSNFCAKINGLFRGMPPSGIV